MRQKWWLAQIDIWCEDRWYESYSNITVVDDSDSIQNTHNKHITDRKKVPREKVIKRKCRKNVKSKLGMNDNCWSCAERRKKKENKRAQAHWSFLNFEDKKSGFEKRLLLLLLLDRPVIVMVEKVFCGENVICYTKMEWKREHLKCHQEKKKQEKETGKKKSTHKRDEEIMYHWDDKPNVPFRGTNSRSVGD